MWIVRPFELGDDVRVHFNLNNEDPRTKWVISRKVRNDKGALGWLVCGYVSDVTIKGVTFKVGKTRFRPGGTQRRAVHAYAFGRLVAFDSEPDLSGKTKIGYTPEKLSRGFHTAVCDLDVAACSLVTFTSRMGAVKGRPKLVGHGWADAESITYKEADNGSV